jgi:hypothetical protein
LCGDWFESHCVASQQINDLASWILRCGAACRHLVGTNAKQSGSLSAKPIVASKSSVESRAMISRKNFPSKRCGQERTMGKKANKESNGNRTANYRVLVKQALSLDVSG